MYTPYLVIAIVALLFNIIIQLIRINLFVLKIKKNKDLNQVIIKEETFWQFIKGLY